MRVALGIGAGLATIGLAALSLACGPGLDPPSLVVRTRIVSARVSPDRDPSLAWPSPGDAITIEWNVVGPPDPIAATLVACAPLGGAAGVPACAGGTFSPITPRPPSPAPFLTTLTLPPAEALGGASSWLILGAVCFGGGTPGVVGTDGSVPECEGGPAPARAELITLSIPLAIDPAVPTNQHPTIGDWPWTLDGAQWDAREGATPESCAALAGDASLPAIAVEPSRDLEITLRWSDDDREAYQARAGDPPVDVSLREALQLSHFTTAGDLARGTSAVDETSVVGEPIALDWTTPSAEEIPEGGLLVRFTLIVRDGRGGVDRADRALCVTR